VNNLIPTLQDLQKRALAGSFGKTPGPTNLHLLPIKKLKQEAKARKIPGTTREVILAGLKRTLKGVQRVPALISGMWEILV